MRGPKAQPKKAPAPPIQPFHTPGTPRRGGRLGRAGGSRERDSAKDHVNQPVAGQLSVSRPEKQHSTSAHAGFPRLHLSLSSVSAIDAGHGRGPQQRGPCGAMACMMCGAVGFPLGHLCPPMSSARPRRHRRFHLGHPRRDQALAMSGSISSQFIAGGVPELRSTMLRFRQDLTGFSRSGPSCPAHEYVNRRQGHRHRAGFHRPALRKAG